MFKIEKRTSFNWPVSVNVPRDNGGYATHEFTVEFKMLEQSKIDALLERFRNDDTDMLPSLVLGWKGVQDANGDMLPFTDENRDLLLDIPYVRTAVTKAFFAAVSGAKKGN